MATDASDRDLTEKGVTFRAKVMALNTVTTVKAYRDAQETQEQLSGHDEGHQHRQLTLANKLTAIRERLLDGQWETKH